MHALRLAFLAALAAPASSQVPSMDAAVFFAEWNDAPFTALADFDADGHCDAVGHWLSSTGSFLQLGMHHNNGDGKLKKVWWDFISIFPGLGPASEAFLGAGQLDGSGGSDFAVGYGDTVRVYTSTASGATLLQTIRGETTVRGLAIADLDADGANEIALIAASGLRLYKLQGGIWSLQASLDMPGSKIGWKLLPGEFSGQAGLDLAVCTPTQVSFATYFGGALHLYGTVAHGVADFMPAAGEVTGDGLDDVVVFGMTEYRLLVQTSPAQFQLMPPVAGGPATDLADVDADGDLDGICCAGGGEYPALMFPSNFEIAIADGAGGFAPSFKIPGFGAEHIAGAQDLDGNGFNDLVAGRVVFFNEQGLTEPTHSSTGKSGPSDRRAFDVDDDGDVDLAFGFQPGHAPLAAGGFPVTILRSQGDGTLVSGTVVLGPAPAGKVFTGNSDGGGFWQGYPGDWNGDGLVDLVGEMWDQGSGAFEGMRVFLNNGGGGLADGGPAAATGVHIGAGSGGSPAWAADSSLAADVDGDGDLDLVVGNLGSQPWGSVLWINNGSGFFARSPVDLTEFGENVTAVLDFTSDGSVDLLTTAAQCPPGKAEGLYLHAGLGGGSFGPGVRPILQYPTGGPYGYEDSIHPFEDRFVALDFDEDGDLDLMAFDAQGGGTSDLQELWFMRNAGPAKPGMFELLSTGVATRTIGYEVPHQVYAADADGDGRPEVLARPVESYLEGGGIVDATYVLHNTGPNPPFWPQPTAHYFAADGLADVDGDGDLDAIDGSTGGTVAWTANRSHHGPLLGERHQYGAGFPGAGGHVPVLGAPGPFLAGQPIELRLRGIVGGAPLVVAVGGAATFLPGLPAPGMSLLVDPFTPPFVLAPGVAAGPTGTPGAGAVTVSPVFSASLLGVPLFLHAIALDQGSATLLSASNGLQIVAGL